MNFKKELALIRSILGLEEVSRSQNDKKVIAVFWFFMITLRNGKFLHMPLSRKCKKLGWYLITGFLMEAQTKIKIVWLAVCLNFSENANWPEMQIG